MQRPLSFITSLVFGMEFVAISEVSKAIEMLRLFPCLQRLEIEVIKYCLCISLFGFNYVCVCKKI